MTWLLSRAPRQTFGRNALTRVVFELRFKPVLTITEGKGIPSFQEKLRGTFSEFQATDTTTLNIAPSRTSEAAQPILNVTREKRFLLSKSDDTESVVLTSSALVLECKRYQTREQFIPDILMAVAALREVYDPIHPTRIGLRYQNVVDSAVLSQDLNRSVGLEEILQPDFLRAPGNLADMSRTTLMTEVRSPVETSAGGWMTLRSGVTPSPTGKICKIEMDRYSEGPIGLEGLEGVLREFSDDTAVLFHAAAGAAFKEWMQPRGGE
jgi:uncharacterized protein (TIGR04255 family)